MFDYNILTRKMYNVKLNFLLYDTIEALHEKSWRTLAQESNVEFKARS